MPIDSEWTEEDEKLYGQLKEKRKRWDIEIMRKDMVQQLRQMANSIEKDEYRNVTIKTEPVKAFLGDHQIGEQITIIGYYK